MIRLLVTGANGQLGREMRYLLADDQRFDAIYTDIDELDITDAEAVNHFMGIHKFDYIVNCAAYTAVDRAEDDESTARQINGHAVRVLASAASRYNVRLIHVSTDYVFDGMANRPYREDDPTHPVSVYGLTKLEGELILQEILPEQHVILRTAWLYSAHGKNFVKTMLELGRTRSSLKVVYDQVGSPTLATDLASAIVTVLSAPQWHPGIYHYSNEGAISWYDFTKAIHRLAGITTCDVQPCLSNEFPSRAHRPSYSVFDKSKFKTTFNVTIPYWEDSLASLINNI